MRVTRIRKRFTKRVESTCRITNIQAETMLGLTNFMSVSRIARYRKKSRQSVYKTLRQLIKKELVEKRGMAYRVTEKGKIGLHSLIQLKGLIRQHNLAIKVEVLESHRNWDKIRSKIIQIPYFNRKIDLNSNFYSLLSMGNSKIKVTTKSVIFYLPSIYGKSVENCIIQMLDILYSLINKVENRFKIRLIKDNKLNMELISQEYARINDELARMYKKEGNKLYITDEQGKVWLIADYSFKTDELETISPQSADEDMIIVHKFMNDLRKNPATISELRDSIGQVTNNQLIFAKNIETHISAIQELGEGVKKLTKLIKELNGK